MPPITRTFTGRIASKGKPSAFTGNMCSLSAISSPGGNTILLTVSDNPQNYGTEGYRIEYQTRAVGAPSFTGPILSPGNDAGDYIISVGYLTNTDMQIRASNRLGNSAWFLIPSPAAPLPIGKQGFAPTRSRATIKASLFGVARGPTEAAPFIAP